MSAFNLKSFSRSDLLKMVQPARLIGLLRQFSAFFTARGFDLPADGEPVDYDALIAILMTPDDPVSKAPPELIDALYVLDEMSTEAGMDALLTGATELGLNLPRRANQAPIDVAVEAWLLDADFVQTKHAEQYLLNPRSFEYYPKTAAKIPNITLPEATALRAMEKTLDDRFEENRRGRGCRVFMFPRDVGIWFLIRHGQPLRREGSIDNGQPSSVVYRPEKFDVIVYDQAVGDLRMNAGSKKEKTLYRDTFGNLLFGDKAFFGTAAKYTLDPLRVLKEASLQCQDIEGVEWIKLREVDYFWGGAENEVEVRKANDVFAAYTAKGREMPQAPKIIKACFEVKFNDSKKTRKIAVIAPNRLQCVRDEDAELVDRWLQARGFVVDPSAETKLERDEDSKVSVDPRVLAGTLGLLGRMGMSPGIGNAIDTPLPEEHRSAGNGDTPAGSPPKRRGVPGGPARRA